MTKRLVNLILIVFVSLTANAQNNKLPEPDLANVKYGEHERNVFDIWFADSNKPTPLAIYIHGGGLISGSKEKLKADELSQLLKAGISVASINYRLLNNAPIPAAYNDAKQALQFIRSNAEEWNIDKERVAAFGGSAGAQICMWLAFSDDMANLKSKNPIERESTRLACVATAGGQTTNDIEVYKNLAAKHLSKEAQQKLLGKPSKEITNPEKKWMAKYGAKSMNEAKEMANKMSAINLVSSDDPPIFMSYFMSPDAKAPNDSKRVRGWIIHHVDFGTALKGKMDKINVEAYLKYPGSESKYKSLVEFFVDQLLEK